MDYKIENWGKDHWSLLAYIETCCVDYGGKLDLKKMRVNNNKCPFGNGNGFGWENAWSSPLKDGTLIDGHDDLDVLDDLIKEELCENIGTEINPMIKLTERGLKVTQDLRVHKINGGTFKEFKI